MGTGTAGAAGRVGTVGKVGKVGTAGKVGTVGKAMPTGPPEARGAGAVAGGHCLPICTPRKNSKPISSSRLMAPTQAKRRVIEKRISKRISWQHQGTITVN